MFRFFRWIKSQFQTYGMLPEYFRSVVRNWHDILWGASLLAVAFVIWWFLGNPSTWIIGIYLTGAMFIAGYYAGRSDHLQLIPKLEIAKVVITHTNRSAETAYRGAPHPEMSDRGTS